MFLFQSETTHTITLYSRKHSSIRTVQRLSNLNKSSINVHTLFINTPTDNDISSHSFSAIITHYFITYYSLFNQKNSTNLNSDSL